MVNALFEFHSHVETLLRIDLVYEAKKRQDTHAIIILLERRYLRRKLAIKPSNHILFGILGPCGLGEHLLTHNT